MYWIYDLSNLHLGLLIVSAFVALSIVLLLATRPFVVQWHAGNEKHNDVVNYYIAAVGVFYGLLIGLIAVGTWDTLSDIDKSTDLEAASISALYRDMDSYPGPLASQIKTQLRAYVRSIINEAWPAQRKGKAFLADDRQWRRLVDTIYKFEPATEGQKIVHAEVLHQLNRIIE